MIISATELKHQLGKYLKQLENENVYITKNEKIIAMLSRYDPVKDGYLVLNEAQEDYCYIGRKVSYEEFLRITESDESRNEYIHGYIYLMTSPGMTHVITQSRLSEILTFWFSGKECRLFTAPLDVTLDWREGKSKNVVQPDLLVICNYQKYRDERDKYTGIPAMVIEILSPGTRGMDLVKKLDVYMEGGVSEYWIADPIHRRVMVYCFTDRKITELSIYNEFDTLQSAHFKGLEFPVADIFRE